MPDADRDRVLKPARVGSNRRASAQQEPHTSPNAHRARRLVDPDERACAGAVETFKIFLKFVSGN
jgi:hypothetical protein